MMMKSVFWWRKPEYPEETTDLRQVTDETCILDVYDVYDGAFKLAPLLNLKVFAPK